MRPGTIGALTGIAAAYAHVRRLSREEALAELRDVLASVPHAHRQRALDEAAAMFVAASTGNTWYPAALDLLITAGADLDTAREISSTRPGGNLGGLGEQDGRHSSR